MYINKGTLVYQGLSKDRIIFTRTYKNGHLTNIFKTKQKHVKMIDREYKKKQSVFNACAFGKTSIFFRYSLV